MVKTSEMDHIDYADVYVKVMVHFEKSDGDTNIRF